MKSFKGATVLVTGASSGIGEAFARNLADRGANLILTARSEDKLHQIAEELSEKHTIQVNVFSGDLSQPDTPQQLWGQVQAASLSVDVLINNAGFGRCGPFLEYDYQSYQDMLNLNIKALVGFNPSLSACDVGEGGRRCYQCRINSGVSANSLPCHLQCHKSICPRFLGIIVGRISRTRFDGPSTLSR